jgi:hypothetical protein
MVEQPQNEPASGDRGDSFHRHSQHSGAWVGGVVLIVIGVIFLLQNTIGFSLENWWALFILIPALSSFERAYRLYQEDGRLSGRARGQAVSGIIFSVIALAFLVGGFGSWWPVLLIIGGLVVLANALLPE